MAELETYNPTLEDIERYLRGKMTAAEMHAMEKAALQDPFLSDAIEGYSAAPLDVAHTHLNEITAALSGGKQEAKVVAMPVKKRGWIKWGGAAAAVVAGIIAVLLITNPSSKENTPAKLAAKQTNTPVFTDTPQPMQQPAVSAPATGDIAAATKVDHTNEKKNDSAVVVMGNTQPLTDKAYTFELKKETIADTNLVVADSLKPAYFSTSSAQTVTTRAKTPLDNNINGYANVSPVLNSRPGGPSYLQNNTANTTAFKAVKPGDEDSLKKIMTGGVTVLNVVQADKNMFLPPADGRSRKSNGLQIVLTPIPNFDTVAITYLNNKNKSPKMVVDSSLSPQGGWENFRDYVVKRLDKKADTSMLEGDVELEFTIDDRGIARDIKITRSLDMEHDAQAADIVKKWPGWITSRKQKKGKVVIQF